jgi:transposase
MSKVARDLGISPNLLTRWCRESANSGGKAFPGQGKPRDEEIAILKRELIQTRKERDFLQEAAAFFARVSK